MKSKDVEVDAAYRCVGVLGVARHRLPMKNHGVQAQVESYGLDATKATDGDY